jgi:hypothetical protein
MFNTYFCLSLFSILLMHPANGQDIFGEYYITGVHEMASGFQLNKDSSFQFFFSYGAVDRMAKGRFTARDGKIILHGDKIPAKDFTIKDQKKEGKGYTIKITDKNTYLQKGIICFFKKADQQTTARTDAEGYSHIENADIDTIFVLHPLYPDVLTTVKLGGNPNNYFELTLNPSLAEVCFQNFELTIEGNNLTGSLPYLFEQEKSVFRKQ